MNALAQTTFRPRQQLRARVRPTASTLDLGPDPPIEVGRGRKRGIERRRVSLRWLCGTILTGLAGSGLISAAIYAAFDRESAFAIQPEFAVASSDSAGDQLVNPRKGDRIVKPVDLVAVKHAFRAPVNVRVGAREVIRSMAFTRVDTPLTMTPLGYSDDVPAFNPLRLLARPGAEAAPPPDPGPAPDEAEASFEIKDLANLQAELGPIALSTDEARSQVAEYARAASEAGVDPSPALPPQLLLMRTSRLDAIDPSGGLASPGIAGGVANAPFSSIEVKMVPENETFVPETLASGAPERDEELMSVRHAETLDDVLRDAAVPADQCIGLDQAFGLPAGQSPVNEGERVKLQFIDGDGALAGRRLARVSIYSDESLRAAAALDDAGAWAPVQRTPTLSDPASSSTHLDAEDDEHAMRVYDSLFETALKAGVPRGDIIELVSLFANEVDMQAPVSGGDAFDVLYPDPTSSKDPGVILYASITAHAQTFKYYRFTDPDDKMVEYYDEDGQSTHKFLIREPILGARLTSPFGQRLHPILGYTRMHTGVDWAAPIGTPIYAAGEGTVIKAGRESGYGNRVEIQHANGYVTTYSHMSGFARGIAAGVHVTQGQVIGYLGMTGLATGPHLHYEVIVNGHFVDPLRVKLARTDELDGSAMARFRQTRDRIERLLAVSSEPPRLADGAP